MLLDRRNEDGDTGGSTYQELNDCRPKSGAVRFIDKFFSFLDFFTADNFKHRATYKYGESTGLAMFLKDVRVCREGESQGGDGFVLLHETRVSFIFGQDFLLQGEFGLG